MDVVNAHEGANSAIGRLNEAVSEWTEATDLPDDGVDPRPKHVPLLPDVDYGTAEGCDDALRAVDDRIERLSDVEDGAAVDGARDEALAAVRDLRQTIGEHRGQLVVADDDDDD